MTQTDGGDRSAEAASAKVPSPSKTWLLVAPALLLAGIGLLVTRPDQLSSEPGPGAPSAAAAQAAPAADTSMFNDPQKRGIEQIVKDYLLKNPELIIEVQGALEAKIAKEETERTKKLVGENAKEIYRYPNAPLAGNPDGDITVVEFFDYNCGYCKRGFTDVAKLVAADPKVRVVFKEFPILSKDSEDAAHLALAARKQGKYWELHRALLESKARITEAVALEAATKLGLNIEQLKADKDSAEVKAEIARVQELAKKMNINGTPHFLVGDEAIGGAPENLFDMLTEKVANLRKNGCTYC
jgi:protein-disulfide isomerase